jgi:hypothetical protein
MIVDKNVTSVRQQDIIPGVWKIQFVR